MSAEPTNELGLDQPSLADQIDSDFQCFLQDLATENGGREGYVAALEHVLGLLHTMPLPEIARRQLRLTLEHLVEAFADLNFGRTPAAFKSRSRKRGRPRTAASFSRDASTTHDRTKSAFRVACVLAFNFLVAKGDTENSAARKVYRRAKAAARIYGLCGDRGDSFTETTIKNWHERHETEWRRWCENGEPKTHDIFNEFDSRNAMERIKQMCGLPGVTLIYFLTWSAESESPKRVEPKRNPELIKDYEESLLSALDPGNIFWSARDRASLRKK